MLESPLATSPAQQKTFRDPTVHTLQNNHKKKNMGAYKTIRFYKASTKQEHSAEESNQTMRSHITPGPHAMTL